MNYAERSTEIIEELVNSTSLTMDEAESLYSDTKRRIREVTDKDEYADVQSDEDIDKMASVSVILVVRLSQSKHTFPSEWRKFNYEMTDFDIGLIYQSAFPERAERSLGDAKKDYEEGRL